MSAQRLRLYDLNLTTVEISANAYDIVKTPIYLSIKLVTVTNIIPYRQSLEAIIALSFKEFVLTIHHRVSPINNAQEYLRLS